MTGTDNSGVVLHPGGDWCIACAASAEAPAPDFDITGCDDVLSVGNNPRIKVLLLHGGPGATHELWEAVDSYFPGAGVESYYYDQLGPAARFG